MLKKWVRYGSSRALHAKNNKRILPDGPNFHSFLQSPSTESNEWMDDLQPVTTDRVLQDRYARHHSYLRISLTERCNLRCTYCMPAQGVSLTASDKLLTLPEMVTLVTSFAQAGVTKLRLTGGEPLIRADIINIVSALSSISGISQVGITTNGITLEKKALALKNAGLTHVNVSLDTLHEVKFQKITRRKGLHRVLSAIHYASTLGFAKVKVNCVIQRGLNDMEIVDFVRLSQNFPLDVRFIEWMPFDKNAWNDTAFMSYTDMLLSIKEAYSKVIRLPDLPNDTSKAYTLPQAAGQFGFITSMSEHFCGSCNRLRITADGNLKVCLFGNTEVSLRDAIRGGISPTQLHAVIHAAVQRKHFALGGHKDMYELASSKNRPMILIGG